MTTWRPRETGGLHLPEYRIRLALAREVASGEDATIAGNDTSIVNPSAETGGLLTPNVYRMYAFKGVDEASRGILRCSLLDFKPLT